MDRSPHSQTGKAHGVEHGLLLPLRERGVSSVEGPQSHQGGCREILRSELSILDDEHIGRSDEHGAQAEGAEGSAADLNAGREVPGRVQGRGECFYFHKCCRLYLSVPLYINPSPESHYLSADRPIGKAAARPREADEAPPSARRPVRAIPAPRHKLVPAQVGAGTLASGGLGQRSHAGRIDYLLLSVILRYLAAVDRVNPPPSNKKLERDRAFILKGNRHKLAKKEYEQPICLDP